MSARRPVEVRIEQLVLTGIDTAGAGGQRMGQSLRSELERLVAAGDRWPAPGADRAFARAGAVEVAPDATAEATGRLIARAVYEELGS